MFLPERRTIAEQFCYDNTQPLVIRLEKMILDYVLLSV